jgi:hypothetical protein
MASDAELRAALEWETGTRQSPDKNLFEWLWEAVQGDFNDDRSTGQIAFDAAVSIIPVVDQICDVRDIIANCRAIATSDDKEDNTWKWVALVLTLIGLFPSLGSIVKGVLKIFFVFMRRYGVDKLMEAADDAMTWVITFLRKREVQRLLRELKVDEVFKWLANAVKVIKGQINTRALLSSFDKGIGVMKGLLGKVAALPVIGGRAKQTIEMVERVRRGADAQIGKALAPLQKILDTIIQRLEMESLVQRTGILDARNVHFRGALPELRAVTLMRQADPLPPWLSKGKAVRWAEQDLKAGRDLVARVRARDAEYPALSDKNIKSFHTMKTEDIKGPARLYRVTSPGNGAMGDCWVPEDVWKKIIDSPDPKTTWRKYSAVWPDWNPNGQFVVLEIPPGQTVKAWRGQAASQVKKEFPDLDANLEGGWDQVVIKVEPGQYDTMRYYKIGGGQGNQLRNPISRTEYEKLSTAQQAQYTGIRERINHPSITGPLDTGWGSTDFDPQLRDARIGLPTLPGQVSN